MSISAFVHQLEVGATHLISVVQADLATGEQRVVAAIHVLEGNMVDAYAKAEAGAIVEIQKIEADAVAAHEMVKAKLAAVKAALGV